jgi:hypothetical protein
LAPHLYIIYIFENSILAKEYGIKVWYYWKHLSEHIGNNIQIAKIPPPFTYKTPKKIEFLKVHVEPTH